MQVSNQKDTQSAFLNNTNALKQSEESKFKGLLDEFKSEEISKENDDKVSTSELLQKEESEISSQDTKTQALELLQSLLVDGQSDEKLEFDKLKKSEQEDLLDFVQFSLDLLKKFNSSSDFSTLSNEQKFNLSITKISFTRVEFSSYAEINFGDFALGKNLNGAQNASFKASYLELESWFFEAKSEEASIFKKSVEDFLKEDILADESSDSNALSYTQKALINENSKPKSALNELLA